MKEPSTLTIVVGVVSIAGGLLILFATGFIYAKTQRTNQPAARWYGIAMSLFGIGALLNGITHLVPMPNNIGLILGLITVVLSAVAAFVIFGVLVRYGQNWYRKSER